MKVTIKDQENKEPKITLELVQNGRTVKLVAYGTREGQLAKKNILAFTTDGEIELSGNAMLDGLKVDEYGRIKVKP